MVNLIKIRFRSCFMYGTIKSNIFVYFRKRYRYLFLIQCAIHLLSLIKPSDASYNITGKYFIIPGVVEKPDTCFKRIDLQNMRGPSCRGSTVHGQRRRSVPRKVSQEVCVRSRPACALQPCTGIPRECAIT